MGSKWNKVALAGLFPDIASCGILLLFVVEDTIAFVN